MMLQHVFLVYIHVDYTRSWGSENSRKSARLIANAQLSLVSTMYQEGNIIRPLQIDLLILWNIPYTLSSVIGNDHVKYIATPCKVVVRTGHGIIWYLPISMGRFLPVLRPVLTVLWVKRQYFAIVNPFAAENKVDWRADTPWFPNLSLYDHLACF